MKKLLAVLALSFVVFTGAVFADQSVRGHYRKDGTYVQPHHRSSPDSSYNNNWSVSPNTNPYSGQQGSRQPTYNDRAPSYGQDNGYNNNQNRRHR